MGGQSDRMDGAEHGPDEHGPDDGDDTPDEQ